MAGLRTLSSHRLRAGHYAKMEIFMSNLSSRRNKVLKKLRYRLFKKVSDARREN